MQLIGARRGMNYESQEEQTAESDGRKKPMEREVVREEANSVIRKMEIELEG